MRKHYLDNIRWVTVLLVVLYHVIYMFNGIETQGVIGPFHPVQYQDALQYLLYPWFMVLLFVVAGASARMALQKQTAKEFIAARTRKLLVPSTLGLLAFQWILGYVNMEISHAFDTIPDQVPGVVMYFIMAVSGIGVLWFIQVLWLYSVLLVPVRKLEKGRLDEACKKCSLPVLLLLAVPMWLSAQILNTPVISVYRFGLYGLAFFLGYFLFSHEEVIQRLAQAWLPLSVGAAVLGIGYTVYYFGKSYATGSGLNGPFAIAFCWVTVLAVFGLMKKFFDKTSPFAQTMGRYSFGLYVFHYLPLAAAALWICHGFQLPAFASYLITGVAAVAGSILLYQVISRIPVLRWCVLGIKKKVEKDVS